MPSHDIDNGVQVILFYCDANVTLASWFQAQSIENE